MGIAAESVELPLPCHTSHTLPTVRETFLFITLPIVITFFIAGFGMVDTGIYLDKAAKWNVFKELPEIIVLVPALLGRTGNLEITLVSRLSTDANLGNMELERMNAREPWSMIVANLILVQCQAMVVSLLSLIFAVLMVAELKLGFSSHNTLLLYACGTLSASVASFILGLVTSSVIVLSKKMHVNPDNIATPIAESIGTSHHWLFSKSLRISSIELLLKFCSLL